MSIAKRVWIENDPKYKDVRNAHQAGVKTHLESFSERLSLRKFCRIEGKQRLDITWRMAVSEAADQLAAEKAIVNDTMMFKSRSLRDDVRKLALVKHAGLFERYGLKPPKRCLKCNEKMRIRLAKAGRSKGRHFWACSQYPACRATQDCSDDANERHWEYRAARGKTLPSRLGDIQ